MEGLLLVDFEFTPYWLQDAGSQSLTAIYWLCGEHLELAVTDQLLVFESLTPRNQFLRWATRHRLVIFNPSKPLRLDPLQIDKPWGREIWYTGVERRGVCHFANGQGRSPVPWLQAVAPAGAIGAPAQPLLLLKILDPFPEPERGELYFELHEEKHEAYVITHIDHEAWPDGEAFIRYGFDPAVVACYANHSWFRRQYLAAVTAYEAQRRALDALSEQGITPDAGQIAREQRLRERMNRFTHLRPLRVGDVVQVPLLLPHALQHGVRTVEFQTPSYERKILSFNQRVQTQNHWDTAAAVAQMRLIPPGTFTPVVRLRADGVEVEQIVDCPHFEVLRGRVEAGAWWRLECGERYALVMVVTGVLEIAGYRYTPEQALLLPRNWCGKLAAPKSAATVEFLLARPRG